MPGANREANGLDLGSAIGSGATCTVHLSSFKGEQVAVKVIQQDQLKYHVAARREIAILSEVSHPNVVSLLSSFAMPGRVHMVLELCSGGDLCSLLYRQDLDLSAGHKVKILKDTAEAMACLHGHSPQIMHRDLKSPNLLLERCYSERERPVVKLCDFGLAKSKDSKGSEWTDMTRGVGSSTWTAPEVETGDYDEKADVFSYAMLMFEVLTQELPFEDENAVDLPHYIRQGVRPDLYALPPDSSKTLSKLMISSWAPGPCSRPSFIEIRAALAKAMGEFVCHI
mmetsp:Transcript_37496/g.82250  ORF Transcript_37496/g.82250 Transcript_37496/m.82250 type:complete len:283 (-) Transcript_37496:192-1040(-)